MKNLTNKSAHYVVMLVGSKSTWPSWHPTRVNLPVSFAEGVVGGGRLEEGQNGFLCLLLGFGIWAFTKEEKKNP